MAKLGFLDTNKKLMAYVEGDNATFGSVYRDGVPDMALKMDGVLVARAEDIDGLRWAVERAQVTVVDAAAVERATLGDNGRHFAASIIQSLNEMN